MKLRLKDFLEHFGSLEQSKQLVQVSGRVLGVRDLGSKLRFADLYSDGQQVQIMMNDDQPPMMRGDIVQVEGVAQMQKNPSIRCQGLRVLEECKDRNALPSRKTGLNDPYLRMHLRHIDLLYNSMPIFQARSRIIKRLREMLHAEGFMEVETPILSREAGGAIAEPFRTKRDVDGAELYMRIAPELFLKRCILGGMERVFEIGKVFRNEGLDKTHQPEFTMCEFYWAYSDLEQVMQFVCEFLQSIGVIEGKDVVKKVDLVEKVEQSCGLNVIRNPEGMLALVKAFEPSTPSDTPLHCLFDKLVSHYVEPGFKDDAVFFMNHPLFSSPLARKDPGRKGQASRFELFISGMEVANGYCELGDAQEQLERFREQRPKKEAVSKGDLEYVEALKMGLPPTVGCGLGIDRLVMLATGMKNIRDVILFPHH